MLFGGGCRRVRVRVMAEETVVRLTVDPVRCISLAPQGKASSEAWRRKLGYSVVGAWKVCQEVIDQRGNFSWFGQEERRSGGGGGRVLRGRSW